MDISWFTSLSFSWNKSLTGTLGGAGRGFALLNIFARVINDLFFHTIVLQVGLLGLDYVLHKINHVRHEKLHLW